MNKEVNSARNLSVGIDTGGTFTDVTLVDRDSGMLWKAKVSSTPADHSIGFIEGIREALTSSGMPAARISHVFHGTTVATNAILESRGAKAALLTTAGFRHVLEIGRHDVPRSANMYHWVKTKRPVPAHLIFEVRERLDHSGQVLIPISEKDVRIAAARIRELNINAVAVCFLHSYANAVHEQRAVEILREELPDVFVSVSYEVLPTFREFERTMATVLNAYVMPVVVSYTERLQRRLVDEGIDAPLLLMKSSGGVTGVDTVRVQPIQTALSGPAGGVVGAGLIALRASYPDIITLDIGGTSADICLMPDAKASMTTEGRIGEWPLQLPILDINTIGAGGGSIARIGPGGLTVGPTSAGASPGPVCYGRGGREPTVTDAHAALGHITPHLLGGALKLDVEAGRAAILQYIAAPLGLTIEEAARGIIDIANSNMIGAIRVVSVERGYDPAKFSLVPFGGAGPLHGSFIGRLLGMKSIVVPLAPGVLSSFGLLVSDLKSDFSRTSLQRPPDYNLGNIAFIFSELEAAAAQWLQNEDVPQERRELRWMASWRYEHQGFELTVDWPSRCVNEQTLADAIAAFHIEHERLYTFSQPDTPVELVQLRVQAIGSLVKPALPLASGSAPASRAKVGEQKVWTNDGWTRSLVYERDELCLGATIDGPAIIQQLDATTYILPGQRGTVDVVGNIVIIERQ